MSKKEISYTGLVKVMMDEAREEAKKLGKKFDNKAAFTAAGERWNEVKHGNDPEFIQGNSLQESLERRSHFLATKVLPQRRGQAMKTLELPKDSSTTIVMVILRTTTVKV